MTLNEREKNIECLGYVMSMKVAALFSGGKDSVYAIYLAQQRGWEVSALVSLFPKRDDSYMFHVPNIRLAPVLAQAMDIPIKVCETEGREGAELVDLKHALSDLDVDGVLTGAIASDYQATRIDRTCHELGLVCFSPLWRWRQRDVLEDVVLAGFKVMVIGVYAEGLGREWLGRVLDNASINELEALAKRHGINVSGEGGELETLVLDGPNFDKRLNIRESEILWSGNGGEVRVTDAALTEKETQA
jgi:diphthine-ammonia ligase